MKLVLYVLNDIVVNISRIEESVIDNTIKSYPYYRAGDEPNTYAKMLRIRDEQNSSQPNSAIVLLLPDDNPDSFIYKKYVKSSGAFENIDGENDNERLFKAGFIRSQHAIRRHTSTGKTMGKMVKVVDASDSQFNLSMIPDESECRTAYGDDLWNKIKKSICERREPLMTYSDWVDIESRFSMLPKKTIRNIIFQMAMYSTIMAEKAVKTSEEVSLNESYIRSVTYWWSKLIGTEWEIRALSEVAAVYAKAGDCDKASDAYEEMLGRSDLSSSDREEIQDKLKYIGRGNSIVPVIKKKFDDGDYDTARSLVEKFRKVATGRALVLNDNAVKRIESVLKCSGHNKKDQERAKRISDDLLKRESGFDHSKRIRYK